VDRGLAVVLRDETAARGDGVPRQEPLGDLDSVFAEFNLDTEATAQGLCVFPQRIQLRVFDIPMFDP
jgi:hypothetical protein